MRRSSHGRIISILLTTVVAGAVFFTAAPGAARAGSHGPSVAVRSPRVASRTSTGGTFKVDWSGVRALFSQPAARYQVVYKEEGETAYKPLPSLGATFTKATGAVFSGESGRTYLFKVRGEDSAGRKGVAALSKTIVPVDDELFSEGAFKGRWSVAADERYYFQNERQSRTAGSAFTYDFSGRRIHLIGSLGPDRGRAKIYLDSIYQGTVDLYAPSGKARRIIWSSPELKPVSSLAPHRLKVVTAGVAGRSLVGIDAVALVK